MMDLHRTQNNNWALFMGHLVIEKLLKSLYVKTMDEYPPLIHDLRRIIEKANVTLDTNQQIVLDKYNQIQY